MKISDIKLNVFKTPMTATQALKPFYTLRDRLMRVVSENSEEMDRQLAIEAAAREAGKNAAFEIAEANVALNKLSDVLK